MEDVPLRGVRFEDLQVWIIGLSVDGSVLFEGSGLSASGKDRPRITKRVRCRCRRSSPGCSDLRHTCASLAISGGANVKVVQKLLGHKTATLTLDRYGHLYPDDLDALATAFDAAQATADWLRTEGLDGRDKPLNGSQNTL